MNASLTTSSPRRLFPWLRPGTFPRRQEEIDQLMQRFWNENGDGWNYFAMAPPVDIKETEENVTVRVDLPGVAADDVEIQLQGNQLTLRGEKQQEGEEKGETCHHSERQSGRFSRTITMPCEVVADKIKATMKNGTLNIVLPKSSEPRSHRIEVKSN
ncbi:Hsp20/alpha crystallin family protein [Bremerella cremea]|uniref:Hsp20/alpha crystallin family protein n=1 Tax=Bremerella cremea TaxID=1031537 RepID=A0A368KWX1_9BACT|nr:Hsp20/alpha crystallin family protein [Bremerella cremea]RCS54155.1 Hsp20/alpha crystallin family protein [Bremerella cremea]